MNNENQSSSGSNEPKKKNTSPDGSEQRSENNGGSDVPESDDTLGENAGGNFGPEALASEEKQEMSNTESRGSQVPSGPGKKEKKSSNPNSDDQLGENAGGNFNARPTAQEERLSRESGDNPTADTQGTEPGSEDDLKSLPGFGTDDDRKEK